MPFASIDPERNKAILYLVVAALGWSLGGLLIKGIHWNPMAISGVRSLIGALFMRVFFRNMKFNGSFHQVMGALAYAGTVILFVLANKMTTAANAILLQYTAPIYVALFSPWFLGERSQRGDWLAIAVVFGGMTLFFLDDLTVTAYWGNCAALASGFCFGWLTLFLRRQRGGSNIESLFLGNLLAAAIGIPFMFSGPSPDAAGWRGSSAPWGVPTGDPVHPLLARDPPRYRGRRHTRLHDRTGSQSDLGADLDGGTAGPNVNPGWGDRACFRHPPRSPARPAPSGRLTVQCYLGRNSTLGQSHPVPLKGVFLFPGS